MKIGRYQVSPHQPGQSSKKVSGFGVHGFFNVRLKATQQLVGGSNVPANSLLSFYIKK